MSKTALRPMRLGVGAEASEAGVAVMAEIGARRCVTCAAILSRYNRDDACAPCYEQARRTEAARVSISADPSPIRRIGAVAEVAPVMVRAVRAPARVRSPRQKAPRSLCCPACGQWFDPLPSGTGRPRAYCTASCQRRQRHARRYRKEIEYQRRYWAEQGSRRRRARRVAGRLGETG